MMNPIIYLIDMVLSLFGLLVFVYILLQLLVHFKVINATQPFVLNVMKFLHDLIEPILNKIRKYIKPYNNIDLSPVVLFIAIHITRYTIVYYFG